MQPRSIRYGRAFYKLVAQVRYLECEAKYPVSARTQAMVWMPLGGDDGAVSGRRAPNGVAAQLVGGRREGALHA